MSERGWTARPLNPGVSAEAPLSCDSFQRPPVPGLSLVALSRQRARLIQEETLRQREVVLAQAHQEGLEQGRREMAEQQRLWLEQAEARLGESLEGWLPELHEQVERNLEQVRQSLAQQLGELVLLASGKSWARLLKRCPEALEDAIAECLSQVFDGDLEAHIAVHPQRVKDLSEKFARPMRADPSLTETEFTIVGSQGRIQGRLEERMMQLARTLSVSYRGLEVAGQDLG